MSNYIKCTTEQETLKAIKDGDIPDIYGNFSIDIRTNCHVNVKEGFPVIRVSSSSRPTIEICGSSSPNILVYDSSTPLITVRDCGSPHIETFDSGSPKIYTYNLSNPSIETCGASSPHIWARDRSFPHIAAYESSSPRIWAHYSSRPSLESWASAKPIFQGAIKVTSSEKTSTIRVLKTYPIQWEVTGEAKVILLNSSDPIDWINFFELPAIDNEFVYLYKALDSDFCSNFNKFKYPPGTTVESPDWDPEIECGMGLHFSPSPKDALQFNPDAEKYVACKVKLSEMVVHPDGKFPEKVKAPRVYEIVEVDIEGNRI